ncbi:MAG: hypothetical protein U9O96_03905 [Candidatus Thermoplasmatota archaeon]|nr:hypothetical protein [Candidatus Thermoplasmatota archaeon]
MKILPIFVLLIFASLAITQANALNVTWTPEHPEPGDKITVYLKADENVSKVILQVCIGDICRLPEQMEKDNGNYVYSFYVNETADVHLNFTVEYTDNTSTWDNSTSFAVEKAGRNSTPGFASIASIIAISVAMTAVFLRKRTKV